MLFKKKPKSLIYLTRTGLRVFTDLAETPLELTFQPNTIVDLENIDTKLLKKQLQTFIKENKLTPEKAVIVLPLDILFTKTITAAQKKGTHEEKIKNFIEEIPFDPNVIEYETFNLQDKVFVVATNKLLYEELAKAFEQLDWEIAAVIPENALGNKTITPAFVDEVLANKDLLKINGFPRASAPKKKQKKQRKQKTKPAKGKVKVEKSEKLTLKKEKSPKKVLIILGVTMIVGGLVIAVAYRFNHQTTQDTEETQPEQAVVEVQLGDELTNKEEEKVETKVETIEENDASSTIQVLNGTGVSGLAGKTKTNIEGLGYTQITVGNAPTYSNEETLVEYKVDINILKIKELLEKSFETITVKEHTNDSSFDIVITTGKLLEE